MSIGVELLKEHRYQELWQHYCGFLDLDLEGFMAIQRLLLLEQIELLQRSALGQRLLGGVTPRTVEEFREEVPLTTYADYTPELLEQREDVLPAKPVLWQRTSGNSGEYTYKWAPITERMYQAMGPAVFAMLIIATCRRHGDINFGDNERLLYALAPPPYATGCWGRRATEELPIHVLPPLEAAENISFEDRLSLGLRLGLNEGIDLVFGLPGVLVALGEEISRRGQKQSIRPLLTRPRALLRVLKALALSRLARRPLMPRDLWSLRAVATAGTDVSIYRERIKQLWGKEPLDVYGSTEGLIIAMQTWDHKDMTFLPHFNFLEFIPEAEHLKSKADLAYHPKTVLLDEVKPGCFYEIVITNFLGGAFVRYRLGDMITITAQSNPKLNIHIPQMAFYSRADNIIDLAGFARLTERTIAQAIAQAGIACEEWVARKEVKEGPVLHIYLELKPEVKKDRAAIAVAIHEQLKKLHEPYAEGEAFLRLKPLELSLLPPGAFRSYIARRRAAGADLAHIKPPHINPSDGVMADLLSPARAAPELTPVG